MNCELCVVCPIPGIIQRIENAESQKERLEKLKAQMDDQEILGEYTSQWNRYNNEIKYNEERLRSRERGSCHSNN